MKYQDGEIKNKNVQFLLTPFNALGSQSVLSCLENSIKIVSIKNKTVLNVTKEKLKIDITEEYDTYEQWLKTKSNYINTI